METQKDGTQINPAPTCYVCAEKSAVRVTEVPEFLKEHERQHRTDLCVGHAQQMLRVHKEKLEVLAVWNGEKMEDWDE